MMTTMEDLKADWAGFKNSSTKTKSDQIMKGLGIIGWTVTYLGVIMAHENMNHSVIWGHVIAYNLVWEGLKSTIWSGEDERWLTYLFGIGWFSLDLFIARKFWLEGDGSSALSLSAQRSLFVACVVLYLGIAFLFHHTDRATLSRIWRHCSFTWGSMIQYGFLDYYRRQPYPYAAIMMVSSAVGNILYIASVRNAYRGWTDVRHHPVRFLVFLTQFVPAIVISTICIFYPVFM